MTSPRPRRRVPLLAVLALSAYLLIAAGLFGLHSMLGGVVWLVAGALFTLGVWAAVRSPLTLIAGFTTLAALWGVSMLGVQSVIPGLPTSPVSLAHAAFVVAAPLGAWLLPARRWRRWLTVVVADVLLVGAALLAPLVPQSAVWVALLALVVPLGLQAAVPARAVREG